LSGDLQNRQSVTMLLALHELMENRVLTKSVHLDVA
jgi:hypothetical protein